MDKLNTTSVVLNNNNDSGLELPPDPEPEQTENECNNSLGPIYKSPLDARKYKALQLPNGMKVMLISTLGMMPDNSASKSKTCHLRKLLQFNKTCLGLDSNLYRIKCDCQQRAPLTADKETSTSLDGKRKNSDGSEISEDMPISLTEAMNAIKALIYGQDDDNDSSASSTTASISRTATTNKKQTETADEEIVNDLESQVASAYLCVGAGWFNDPEEMPGMAHFVEHSFFLGSKKFPFPNQLFRLILPHDGYTNAYTGGSQTVYEISTSLEIFALALEMLGDGVGFPLLPRDLVAKEIDALDSEFSLRQDDIPKYNQLLASLAKENHPLRKMDTGNKDTLRVKNFHSKLVRWREEHYCANYMTLALEAPIEIGELEELATQYFSEIPSSNLPNPRVRIQTPGSPFEAKSFHKIFLVPSIYHSEFMAIHWALEPQTWKNLSTKPLEYLGSLISHKGEGSLYQFLNYFGWASNVTSGSWDSDVFSNHFTSIFTVYVDLTEEGFQKQEIIVHAVFGYLEMLCTNEPSLGFFQELQKQHADYFHHRAARSSTSYCEETALWLQYLPAKFSLVAPQLITKFEPKAIKDCLKSLTVEACNIMVFSKKYLFGETDNMSSMESFYQTPYTSRAFPQSFCDQINHTKKQLASVFGLPTPNPYLKEITCCGGQQKHIILNGPLLIVKGKCSVYYKDEKFNTLKGQFPQAKYVFWFHSPVMNTGQKTETMMDLFANFINEMIEDKFSSALQAHFHIHAKVTPGKLEVSLTGPSNQLPTVTKDVFKIIIFFEKLLDEATFYIGKRLYTERMDNIALDNVVHSWEIINFMWANHYQLSSEHVRQTQRIDYPTFLKFVKSFKSKIYIAAHLHGFISIEQSFHLVQTVVTFMKIYPEPVMPAEIQSMQCPRLPVGESVVKLKSKNTRTPTSVVINGYQFGHLNNEDNEIVNFLAKCMSDNAYHQLRTLEQLGYIVLVYYDQVFSVTSMFLEVVTQPKNFSTDYCNKRMDQFIMEFYNNYISDQTKFERFLKGKPKVEFELSRVQELYQKFLLPNLQHFRKMSVQVVGNLIDAFIITQKAHAKQAPLVYVPNVVPPQGNNPPDISALDKSKTKMKAGKGKSEEKLFTNLRKVPQAAKQQRQDSRSELCTTTSGASTKSRTKNKKANKSKNLARGYPRNTSTRRSKSLGATGDQNNYVSHKEPFSRFVKDIYKFRSGLPLYPNHASFRVDKVIVDDDASSSRSISESV